MDDILTVTVIDDPHTGFFRVTIGERCIATFHYCTKGEGGFFTKSQAKKLTVNLVRKIKRSKITETKKGIELI
jgi:hypothetical protein